MDIGPEFERAYDAHCEPLSDLGPVAERLIKELLLADGLRLHSVRFRVKSKESVQRKVGRDGSSYESLREVHDLLGLRVITFFPDEVDRVASVIEREFEIDEENSVDKRALLDPDRFGYLSRHYVAALSEERSRLTEHVRFRDLYFEIQIRSILQHAWAEIEHDLGYHAAAAIPGSVRRRFSRLAGLLEIADDEFQTLRNEVAQYQQEVDEDVDRNPASVAIDQDSILAFLKGNDEIRNLDRLIAGAMGRDLIEDPSATAGPIATELRWIGKETIDEIGTLIQERQDLVVRFASRWTKRAKSPRRSNVYAGISLFYLAYTLAADQESADYMASYLSGVGIGPEDASLLKLAQELLDTYDEVKHGD